MAQRRGAIVKGHNRAPQGYLDRVYVAEHDGMHQKETDRRPTIARAPALRQGCRAGLRTGANARRGGERHGDSLFAWCLRVPLPQKKISMA